VNISRENTDAQTTKTHQSTLSDLAAGGPSFTNIILKL